MNLLFIYRRDIHIEDSGASRTIILRENYLAAQPDVYVYTSYRHLSPVDSRITELPIKRLSAHKIHESIVDKGIDILCVPEGEHLAEMAYEAIKGTSCKIVTELHSMPNYELQYLYSTVSMRTFTNCVYSGDLTYSLKLIIKLLIFPLWKIRVRKSAYKKNRESYLLADKLVLLSESFIEAFQKAYHVDNQKMVVINNPCSFSSFLENRPVKDNVILVVSRLEEGAKRISLVLKCWSLLYLKYPNWKLQIVGKGPSSELYKKMSEKLGLKNVSFEGWQSPQVYYEKASIFLMTSAIEGWGMTLIEAQQMGCVPIAMNSFAALKDIIKDGQNGFIVKNNNINEMALKIEKLIMNQDKMYEMSLNAIQSVQKFSIEKIGAKWLDLYRELSQCHEQSKA